MREVRVSRGEESGTTPSWKRLEVSKPRVNDLKIFFFSEKTFTKRGMRERESAI